MDKSNSKNQKTPTVAPQELKEKNVPQSIKPLKKSKSDDTGHIYCYVLTTLEQKKAIKLTQHKAKLEKIIQGFFGDRLLGLTFTDDSYTLTLVDEYSIGNKRRLGRLISEGSDLQKFVKKVIYNGEKDTSGQLFHLKKEKS